MRTAVARRQPRRLPAAGPTRDQRLVARIRSGDIAAFEALHAEFAPGLLRFAIARLRSPELAEEHVQDLFLALWRSRQQWVLARSLEAYLFGALWNRIINYWRTAAARHELVQAPDDADALLPELPGAGYADDRVREADLLEALERAVTALPPRCRETFVLVRRQRLSYAAAAAAMGITVKAVEMNMVRAFAALRVQLADWCR